MTGQPRHAWKKMAYDVTRWEERIDLYGHKDCLVCLPLASFLKKGSLTARGFILNLWSLEGTLILGFKTATPLKGLNVTNTVESSNKIAGKHVSLRHQSFEELSNLPITSRNCKLICYSEITTHALSDENGNWKGSGMTIEFEHNRKVDSPESNV